LNLNQESTSVEGHFDAIFCRNVLIYFDAASKRRVVENLSRHLLANGFLFVGHAENLSSMFSQLRSLEPTIYTHTEGTEKEDRR
jgi:chemotaxis protein methyltransferase CheR